MATVDPAIEEAIERRATKGRGQGKRPSPELEAAVKDALYRRRPVTWVSRHFGISRMTVYRIKNGDYARDRGS